MSVRVFWDAPAGAQPGDVYDVYRKLGSLCPVAGSAMTLLAAGVTDLFYVDATVVAGSTYSYRVKARRGFGASGFSRCASIGNVSLGSLFFRGDLGDSYVKFDTGYSPGGSNRASFSLWVNVEAIGGGLVLFGANDFPAVSPGHAFLGIDFQDPGPAPNRAIALVSAGVSFETQFSYPLPDNTLPSGWHMYTVTYDDPSGETKLYYDAVLKATRNFTANTGGNLDTSTGGGWQTVLSAPSGPFKGHIGQMLVYDRGRVLTQAEITRLFGSGSGLYMYPGDPLYPDSGFNMDEGSGSIITDFVGGSIKGTLAGAHPPTWDPGFIVPTEVTSA
jgi:hypothetical protein